MDEKKYRVKCGVESNNTHDIKVTRDPGGSIPASVSVVPIAALRVGGHAWVAEPIVVRIPCPTERKVFQVSITPKSPDEEDLILNGTWEVVQ